MLLRIVTFVLGLVIAAPSFAAELLMFRDAACMWCARWEAEVAPHYADSAEGRRAPLKRLDFRGDPLPDGLELDGRIRYTPTFVLVDQGREVGRILGYPGESAFWSRLGDLIGKLEPDDRPSLDSAEAAALPGTPGG